MGKGGHPHYSASKAAELNLTQSHAHQLASYNINVNAICPGDVWTSMAEQNTRRGLAIRPDSAIKGLTLREHFEKMVESSNPMKREQTSEDMDKLAAFLASGDACNITGQAINGDSGGRLD